LEAGRIGWRVKERRLDRSKRLGRMSNRKRKKREYRIKIGHWAMRGNQDWVLGGEEDEVNNGSD